MEKKLAALLLFAVIAFTAYAEANESPYYVKTVPISKVYVHEDGYKIVYRNSQFQFGTIYVPMEWFGGGATKAELIYGNNESYPYFSVFWKDGQFAHIRLYLKKDRMDLSWGDLDPNVDISGNFSNVETIKLNF